MICLTLPGPASLQPLITQSPSSGKLTRQDNCTGAPFEVNTDYHGGDVGNSHGGNAKDCCRQCATVPDCVYFTYKISSHQCYFKKTKSGKDTNTDCISGSRGNSTVDIVGIW